MTDLKRYKHEDDRAGFIQAVMQLAPGLRNYIHQRLRSAERRGLIPEDLYDANDVLDDILLQAFDQLDTMPTEPDALRVRLFQLADNRLDAIIEQEAWHRRAVRLEDILADEMTMLDEIPQMTVDADGDIVLVEELDDAELEPPEPEVILLEDSFEAELLDAMGVDRARVQEDEAQRALLAHLYDRLPEQSRILVDLWTRGRLSVEEIAQVRGIPADQVRAILTRIRAEFRRWFD
jgi:DNA-directed RNA polymerase specialized sigma24 family protein